MTEYYEEGGLLYERSAPVRVKVESPEQLLKAGALSEDGFPGDEEEEEDDEAGCDRDGGPAGELPFNVVVVHPNTVEPGIPTDDYTLPEQNGAVAGGKRKSRFSGAELEVLVSEVTSREGELFGPAGRLRRRERERIWADILERVNAVSRVPRTLREVKKRWDDLKRRNGGRLADARHRRRCPPQREALPAGRGGPASPRLQARHRPGTARGKASTGVCTPAAGAGLGLPAERGDEEREGDEGVEELKGGVGGQEEDGGEEEGESTEDRLGLGVGVGVELGPSSAERWLPPSPLYSAPFLNGTPHPSPPPPPIPPDLVGAPRGPWLEEELRGLSEAAVRLGDQVELSLREWGEAFQRDARTLAASQEALAASLQQNNILLQRLLGILERQQPQPQPPPAPPPPPDLLDGTAQPDPLPAASGRIQRPRRGRPGDQKRRRRRHV
uniref:Si:ch211-261d7.3 n=1 Tax=Lepisosteus oculatus TaxID=7918 RepID=W5M9I9_LEPOC|nr:PREDICTED: myb-related transcription factor, partner of profilin-like [Lepisosteus oculatus]